MCNVAGCTFCAGASAFGAFFLFLLGILIKSNYQHIGEWYEPEPPHHAPTPEQIEKGARSCFITGAIYIGWTVFALGCVCFQNARAKRLPQ